MKKTLIGVACIFSLAGAVQADPLTETSPTGGPLPAGITRVGGIVVDLKGTNGTRVVSQLAASSLFVGSPISSNNPLLIGTQTGFTQAVIDSFGGGLASVSIRISLFDGDTAPGDFDFSDNFLTVNNVGFGNFSNVATSRTSADGITTLSSGTGFGNQILSTGFFTLSDLPLLATFFGSLSGGNLAFRLNDLDPGDQFYDFTQGIDGGLINVGQGPVVVGAIPEPTTWAMMLIGFGAVGYSLRRWPLNRAAFAV